MLLLPYACLVSSCLQLLRYLSELLDQALQSFWRSAFELSVGGLPVLVDEESRHAPDVAVGRDTVELIDVHLDESHAWVFRAELLEEGSNTLARSAPSRCKVDHNLFFFFRLF